MVYLDKKSFHFTFMLTHISFLCILWLCCCWHFRPFAKPSNKFICYIMLYDGSPRKKSFSNMLRIQFLIYFLSDRIARCSIVEMDVDYGIFWIKLWPITTFSHFITVLLLDYFVHQCLFISCVCFLFIRWPACLDYVKIKLMILT